MRCRPIRPNASVPPRIPPAPIAADMTAAPDSPVPKTSIASRTNSTSVTPIMSWRADRTATTSRASLSAASARKPPSTANPCVGLSMASSTSAWELTPEAFGRSPNTSTAPRPATPASTPTTAPGPATTRIAAAPSGPRRMPVASAMLVTALAAVSSDGLRASDGNSALCVGRTRVSGTTSVTAIAYTISGSQPDSIPVATRAMFTASSP